MATIHNSSHAQTSILCSSVVSPKFWEGNFFTGTSNSILSETPPPKTQNDKIC